jgi:hypothetical protein
MEHLFILVTMGDMLVPLLPPYYSLRLPLRGAPDRHLEAADAPGKRLTDALANAARGRSAVSNKN